MRDHWVTLGQLFSQPNLIHSTVVGMKSGRKEGYVFMPSGAPEGKAGYKFCK